MTLPLTPIEACAAQFKLNKNAKLTIAITLPMESEALALENSDYSLRGFWNFICYTRIRQQQEKENPQ